MRVGLRATLSLSVPWAIVAAGVIVAAGPAAAAEPTPFRQCVVRAIAALDDFMSPADVIAAGAVEECRDMLPADIKKPDLLEHVISNLKARTVPEVLRFRAKMLGRH